MKLFDIDSPLYKFMSTLTDILKLNFCWLLCSLPIVTIGASTVAAYSVALKMADHQEGYVVRQFFQAFQANLKQGIVLGLIAFVAIYSVWFNFVNFHVFPENLSVFLLILGIIGAVVIGFSLLYAFALLARYENSIFGTLKNSFRISMRYLPQTIMVLFVLVIEVIVICFNKTTIFFGILIGPACIFYTVSGVALYIFRRIEADNS